MTLDGLIAPAHGPTPRLAGPADLAALRLARSEADALLVGARTVRAIDPPMASGSQPAPLVVVLSRRGEVPAGARALALPAHGAAPWLVTTAAALGDQALAARVQAGTLVHHALAGTDDQVDVRRLCAELARAGCRQVLVEGGGRTLWPFVEHDLLDALEVCIAPCLLGGPGPRPVAGTGLPWTLRRRFRLVRHRVAGNDLLLRYERPPPAL